MQLYLNRSVDSFQWFEKENIFVKGYLFDENQQFYQNESLIRYFEEITNEEEFREKLENANGFYSVVIQIKEMVFVAVDHLRSIPLFYSIHNEELYVSDDAYWINGQVLNGKITLDNTSRAELLYTGYVTGSETLNKYVKQVQAGEYLVYNGKNHQLFKKNFFLLHHKSIKMENEEQYFQVIDKVHEQVFKRLINSLQGKTAIIPLSGGLDSRIIVQMLKKYGYDKVICFSYGQPGNAEAKISKLIADYLGYPWIFVPYEKDKWKKWYDSDERKEYFKYASQLASLPHIQDWPAVLELKEKNLIPKNSVFIPGHAYDFLQGGHIPTIMVKKKNVNIEEVKGEILKKHYSLYPFFTSHPTLRSQIEEKIQSQIGNFTFIDHEKAADLFEYWDWRERQAKFIGNSIRVYDFFGYEWRLPLWDRELIDFWATIPLELRYKRKLYYLYVNKNETLQIPGIAAPKVNVSGNSIMQTLKKYPSLNRALKKTRDTIKMIRAYNQHPLGWFQIVNFYTYLKMLVKGADNINSILVTLFLSKDLPEYERDQRGYKTNG